MTLKPYYAVVACLAVAGVLMGLAYAKINLDQTRRVSAQVSPATRLMMAIAGFLGVVIAPLLMGIPGVMPWWDYEKSYTRIPLAVGGIGLLVVVGLFTWSRKNERPRPPTA